MSHDTDFMHDRDNSMRSAPTALTMSAGQWSQVLDHLRAALPAEGCGLLACPESAEGNLAISHIIPGRNTLMSPTRFRMDGAEVVAAFRFMREKGLRLAAIFHSHPTTAPTLSAIDVREANFPDAAIVIVSFARSSPEAQAWRVTRQGQKRGVAEIPIHVLPG